MDIVENHINKMLNYKIKFVDIAYVLLQKYQYGEDICCRIKKLYLASRLINRLDNYCFPSGITMSQFTIIIEDYVIGPDIIYSIELNGSLIGTRNSNISQTSYQMYNALFSNIAGLVYHVEYIDLKYHYRVYAGCDITSIETFHEAIKETLTPSVLGNCTEVVCYNCTTDSDLPKLYEVLDNLLK